MTGFRRATRGTAIALAFLGLSACSNSGSLGNILGSVLGGGTGNQLAGRIQGVDTRNQQIGITQDNGQTVAVRYDNQTRVVYQSQTYPVTALEQGDEVVARISDAGNGSYYTDSIEVTRSVTNGSAANPGAGEIQTIRGTVRQVDVQQGVFTIDNGSGYEIVVSMPYNARQADRYRFERLARGNVVQFAGVVLNTTRIELRQFY
jgi:YD repeat-containing protein